MTFLEMQTAVMSRLNLSSTESRTRIKAELNLRNREVCSSVGLAPTRRSTVSANTVANNNEITFTSVADIKIVYDAVNLKRRLDEVTVNDIREKDPGALVTGFPSEYAVKDHLMDSVKLLLYPKPTTVYALTADVLAKGTTMTADGDTPSFPEDFHDVLVLGAIHTELLKMEKSGREATDASLRFEKRLSELRYFLRKRAYLSTKQQDRDLRSGRIWPYGV